MVYVLLDGNELTALRAWLYDIFWPYILRYQQFKSLARPFEHCLHSLQNNITDI